MPASESGKGDTGVVTTQFVTSKDGTRIAFDRTGDGPPVIVVAGAFGNRSFGEPAGALLAREFTVFNYDRRGRNESGDTPPYAVEREIEDIEALLNEAGRIGVCVRHVVRRSARARGGCTPAAEFRSLRCTSLRSWLTTAGLPCRTITWSECKAAVSRRAARAMPSKSS